MKKAFTMIELMIVISVIGLLSAIAIPKFLDIQGLAKVANVQGNLISLRTAIIIYYAKTKKYPAIENNINLEDIKNGDYKFTDFYNKSKMPKTPYSDGTDANNSVVTSRNNTGGWIYLSDTGEIYANLKNGTYTGNETNEIWQEELVNDGSDGGGDSSSTWDDFLDNHDAIENNYAVNIGHGGYVSPEGVMPGLYLAANWQNTVVYTGRYYVYIDGGLLKALDGNDYRTGNINGDGNQVEYTENLYVGAGSEKLTVAFEYNDENGEKDYYYKSLVLNPQSSY